MKERLVRCWNCKQVINLNKCDPCEHPDATCVCPYCKKCLCENPNYGNLKKNWDDKYHDLWHVGEYLTVVTERMSPENPKNACPAKSRHVNGAAPLSGDPQAKPDRENSSVQKDGDKR